MSHFETYENTFRYQRPMPVTYGTTADYTSLDRACVPRQLEAIEGFLGGDFFLTGRSLGVIAGLNSPDTTRISGKIGNFTRNGHNEIGRVFALPKNTVLFHCADRRNPRATRHINVCAVAYIALAGISNPKLPNINGLGARTVNNLVQGLSQSQEEIYEHIEQRLKSS